MSVGRAEDAADEIPTLAGYPQAAGIWAPTGALTHHPGMDPLIVDALERGRGVLMRACEPGLAGRIDAARKRGELVSVLPGVYAPSDAAARLDVRARAACVRDPDAIVVGAAAAWLHGWEALGQPDEVAVATHVLRRRPGFRFERRDVPPELLGRVHGIPVTSAPLTAVELIPERGPDAVNVALRSGVRLSELWTAFERMPGRRGNAVRREVLLDSRDSPWSAAERRAHRALRDRGIDGWATNHPVRAASSSRIVAYADVAFPLLWLDIEIDGRGYHDSDNAFVSDRARDERLALLGWQVVRFAASRVFADPDGFADAVAALVEVRARQLGR
ncbi:DUF559 domain-containing protein [Brooklawnia cerclae]|uniref:Very-short-patch-repair endonuclease n=1 Tax=Brooklawnia cerclae TaxID=349934 RepID=A0ABX0SBF8_9ACTN|nr:very-short-patch-repair endonuclease [Brooklawnia cerclae]